MSKTTPQFEARTKQTYSPKLNSAAKARQAEKLFTEPSDLLKTKTTSGCRTDVNQYVTPEHALYVLFRATPVIRKVQKKIMARLVTLQTVAVGILCLTTQTLKGFSHQVAPFVKYTNYPS